MTSFYQAYVGWIMSQASNSCETTIASLSGKTTKRKHIQEKADELNQQQKRIKLDIESLHKTADMYCTTKKEVSKEISQRKIGKIQYTD